MGPFLAQRTEPQSLSLSRTGQQAWDTSQGQADVASPAQAPPT